MKIEKLLLALDNFEKNIASFYSWLSELFMDNPLAASTFKQMSIEESSHSAIIQFQLRLIKSNHQLSEDVDIDTNEISEIISSINLMKSASPPPAIKEAVFEALRIEESVAELYYKTAIKMINPNIAKMVEALNGSEKIHSDNLNKLADNIGIKS